jgi:oligoendopeptidase F
MSLLAVAAVTINLARYFPSAQAELSTRSAALSSAERFIKIPATQLRTPQALVSWLDTNDHLLEDLQRHDIYVYLRAEEDSTDDADAAADLALGAVEDRLQTYVEGTLFSIGAPRLERFERALPSLRPYGYFITT